MCLHFLCPLTLLFALGYDKKHPIANSFVTCDTWLLLKHLIAIRKKGGKRMIANFYGF